MLEIIPNMKKIFFQILLFSVLLATTLSRPVAAQTCHYPDSSVLNTGKWFSLKISSDGVYKLTYNDFVSMGFTSEEIDFDNLSIYGNGGVAISEVNADYKNSDLQENAIYVNKPGRYALFYAKGPIKTSYEPTRGTFDFSMNPYSDQATYFVSFDAGIGQKKRIEEHLVSEQYDTIVDNAQDFFLYKRELYNLLQAGDLWMGEKLTPSSPTLSVPIVLNNILPDYRTKIKIDIATESSSSSWFSVKLNNSALGTIFPGPALGSDYVALSANKTFDTAINNANNNINIEYNPTAASDKAYINYILINYTKKLVLNNGYLRFFATRTFPEEKTIQYRVDNVISSSTMVWDISDINNVFSLSGTNLQARVLSFNVKADSVRVMAVVAGTSFPTPTFGTFIDNQNLHASPPADFVIITHKNFLEQAEKLAQIHRDYDNISVAVVDIDKIYNEFSSGSKDFLAIREFLRMMYNKYLSSGKNPKNVLLFGDGTFDNKNILGYNNNFIPTYQTKGSFANTGSVFTSDDVLACLSDYSKNRKNDTLLIGVGRLPVNDSIEAETIVDKCRRYMIKNDLLKGEDGDWRNFIMLSSDDADDRTELYFIRNAENIYKQIDETQPYINIQKVYEDAYKETTSSSGAVYPDASNAIDDRMNKGCLLFNYLGHGSYDHLSSERLITKSNISSWSNKDKLPLMITSTCEFARYDLADKQSAGEGIVLSENGAGIALIAAARKIASNDGINRNLHKFALMRKADGSPYSFGEVVMNAKNNTAELTIAERSISLLGDPALKISLPKYNVKTTRINNSFYNDTTLSFVPVDTSGALSKMHIEGEIRDFSDNKIEDFNGKIKIYLFDKKTYYHTLDNSGLDTNLRFEQQSNLLHKGFTNVINGKFEYDFIVPKDIAYNYGKAKLSYYAQDSNTDAAGYTNSFILGGIDTTVALYESRPILGLYMNDSNFVSGGMTDQNPSLYATVYDTIPINIAGAGLGHDIVARLDNAANTFILNDSYTYDEEDINKGYLNYKFYNLQEGEHTLSLKVWNIFNYSAEQTITFNVVNSKHNEYEMYNYPNPFSESTDIIVKYNVSNGIKKAVIKIYNAQGRILKTFDATKNIGTYNISPIRWDGRVDGGGRIGSGIYYYTVELTTGNNDVIRKTNKMLVIK